MAHVYPCWFCRAMVVLRNIKRVKTTIGKKIVCVECSEKLQQVRLLMAVEVGDIEEEEAREIEKEMMG